MAVPALLPMTPRRALSRSRAFARKAASPRRSVRAICVSGRGDQEIDAMAQALGRLLIGRFAGGTAFSQDPVPESEFTRPTATTAKSGAVLVSPGPRADSTHP